MSTNNLFMVVLLLGVGLLMQRQAYGQLMGQGGTPYRSATPASAPVSGQADSSAPPQVIAASKSAIPEPTTPPQVAPSSQPGSVFNAPLGTKDDGHYVAGGVPLPPLRTTSGDTAPPPGVFIDAAPLPAGQSKIEAKPTVGLPVPSNVVAPTNAIPLVPPAGPSAPVVTGGGAALSVRVDGTAQAVAGELLSYEITVRNTGSVLLSEVRLEQALPSGVTLASITPPGRQTGGSLVWDLGTIEIRGERHLHLEIQPGTVEEFGLDPVAVYKVSNALKTRVQQPPFVVLQQGPESVSRGGKATLQITVANHGATPLHEVKLHATLSPGLQHAQGGQIEAEVGTLGAGEMRTLPMEVLASQGGVQTCAVVAGCKEGPISRSKLDVVVKETGLVVQAVSSPLRSSPYAGAGEMEIHLDITNPLRIPARNLRILLQYPDRMEVLQVSDDGKLDQARRLLHWSPPWDLAPGVTRTIVVQVRASNGGEWPCQIVVAAEGIPEARFAHVIRVGLPQLAVSADPGSEGKRWAEGRSQGK